MKLRLLRSPSGKLMGIAVLRSKVELAYKAAVPPWGQAERYCDRCWENMTPAIVFCTTDNLYLCEDCLAKHTNVLGVKCNYISVAVARELFAQLEKMCK